MLSVIFSWWRHQMETFSALLAICAGNSPVPGEFPAQRPVPRSFDVFSLICVWINGWVNNREAGDLRRYRAHYDVTVMFALDPIWYLSQTRLVVYWSGLVRTSVRSVCHTFGLHEFNFFHKLLLGLIPDLLEVSISCLLRAIGQALLNFSSQ